MKIVVVIELIFALSLGFALARARLSDPRLGDTVTVLDTSTGQVKEQQAPLTPRFFAAAESVFFGVVLLGGFTTWIERARGRSPHPWGPGRWVWSILGTFGLLSVVLIIIDCYAMKAISDFESPLLLNLRDWHADSFFEIATRLLLALGVTYVGSRTRFAGALDARELAGRLIAISIITFGIAAQVLRLTGIPMLGVGGGLP